MDIATKRLLDLVEKEDADLVKQLADIAGCQPDELVLGQPTVAQYNSILKRAGENTDGDIFSSPEAVSYCVQKDDGSRALTQEQVEGLPFMTGQVFGNMTGSWMVNIQFATTKKSGKAMAALVPEELRAAATAAAQTPTQS